MANLTTIDSNQLVEHDIPEQPEQEQEKEHVGQLFSQTLQENPTTSIAATEISATTTATNNRAAHCSKQHKTLEQQLLIELNSGDKTDMIVKNNKNVQKENMEFRQIELIYRAEGNANLVLALPQFKKVLRLPKSEKPMIKQQQQQQQQQIEQEAAALQTKQSTPHVVANIKEEEAANNVERAPEVLDDDKKEKEEEEEKNDVEKEDSITMQYQNTSASSVVHQNAKELTMQDFTAYMQIIRQIVGQAYVLDAKIVSIPKESDRNWINEQIRPHRPAHRLNKEFHGHFGLLLPDATLLPVQLEVLLADLHQPTAATLEGDVYAIEIKTKQGWLLPSDVNDLFDITPATTVSDSTSSVSGSSNHDEATRGAASGGAGGRALNKLDTRCRYCLMQFLKLKQNKIDRVSTYCPMDLFSGNAIRMLKALDALFECPQNNLRLYRNGRLIYGDHANTMSCQHLKEQLSSSNMKLEQLKQLLMVSLLRDYSSSGSCSRCSNSNKSDKAMVVRSDVVKAVSSIGQVGCANIEEGIMTRTGTTETEMTQAKAQQLQINGAETECLPKNCVLQQILHLQLLSEQHLRHMSDSGYVEKTGRTYDTLNGLLKRKEITAILNNLNAYEKYMLGATFLDCSIIIAFQEIKPSLAPAECGMFCQNILELADVKPRYFLSKVSIIDLDPKPDSHFHKYLKQTKEAIAAANSEMAGSCAKDPSD